MSLGQQTLSGFIWTFISSIGTKLSSLVVGVVLARLLTPDDFGLVAMLYIFFDISKSFVDSGFSQALIREKNLTEQDKSTTFSVNIIVSIVFYAILWTSAPYIADFYNQPILTDLTRLMGLSIIIQAFTIVQQAELVQSLRFKELSYISVAGSIGAGSVAIIMAYIDYGVWSLATKYVLLTAVQTILLYFINPWIPQFFIVKDSFKKLFAFGSKLFVSGLINTLYQNIYKVIIGKVFSASALGYYTQAKMYVDQVSKSSVHTIQQVTYPVLSKSRDDEEQLKKAYRKIILATSFVIFPMIVGLGLLAEPLILTLVGKQWLPAVPFLQLFCASGALYHLHSININLLKVLGRSDLILKLQVIKKVNTTIAIIIGLQFGIWGLLIGQVISSYIALYINMYYTNTFINYPMSEQLQDIIPVVFFSLPMSFVVIGSTQLLIDVSWLKLTTGVLSGIVTYVIFSVILKPIAFIHIVRLLRPKFPLLNKIDIDNGKEDKTNFL